MTKINSFESIRIKSEIFKNTDNKVAENKQTGILKQVAKTVDTKKDTRQTYFMPKPTA